MIHSTFATTLSTVTYHAFPSIPVPGLSDKLNTLGGWATFLSYFCLLYTSPSPRD